MGELSRDFKVKISQDAALEDAYYTVYCIFDNNGDRDYTWKINKEAKTLDQS